eukprot:TRINITY_DN54485_c0_g1_i1.p1 TRINITY_DN54485_c0_g1~~TRINITY_DN54485_c0_g1_i1.p1  ORF type:complete len:1125 (-),score=167.78 TRINITY_DN54485_c0_g1_i1:62-3436(-)
MTDYQNGPSPTSDGSLVTLLIWSLVVVAFFQVGLPRLPALDTFDSLDMEDPDGVAYMDRVKHYLTFLDMGQNLFITLSLMSLVWVVPSWGLQYYLLFLPRGIAFRVSIADNLDAQKLILLCPMCLSYAVVAFYFVARYQQETMRRIQLHKRELNALWLNNIPVRDRATLQPHALFQFTNVVTDLKEAIQDKLLRRGPAAGGGSDSSGFPFQFCQSKCCCWHCNLACTLVCRCCKCCKTHQPRIRTQSSICESLLLEPMDITVQPVMSKYSHYVKLYNEIKDLRERQRTYERKLREVKWAEGAYSCFRCCRRLLFLWYVRKKQVADLTLEKREVEFRSKRGLKEPMRMSGDAFVVFEEQEHKDEMLEPRRRWWEIRDHTPFKFGRPAFSSVTLQCRHAPHPTDLVWENLHVPRSRVCLRYSLNLAILIVLTVASVCVIAVASQMRYLSGCSKHDNFLMERLPMTCTIVTVFGKSAISGQFPTVLLMFNSLVLPWWIETISYQMRLRQQSMIEIAQLSVNLGVLVLSKLVVPVGSLVLIKLVLEYISISNAQDVELEGLFSVFNLLPGILGPKMDGLGDSGMFYLKYTLNCAFLSNAIMASQFGRHFCRCFLLCFCTVTDRDRAYSRACSLFPMGYWYAWSISLFANGLIIGIVVPSMLPVTALSFRLKLRVDKSLFAERAFDPGPDSKGMYPPRCAHYMFCIIVAMLFSTSCFVFLFTACEAVEFDGALKKGKAYAWAWFLIATGLALWIFSRVSKLQLMLEESFAPTVTTLLFECGVRLSECFDRLLMRPLRPRPASEVYQASEGADFGEESNLRWDGRESLLAKTLDDENEATLVADEAKARADKAHSNAIEAHAFAEVQSEKAKDAAADVEANHPGSLEKLKKLEKLERVAATARRRAERATSIASFLQKEAEIEASNATRDTPKMQEFRSILMDLFGMPNYTRKRPTMVDLFKKNRESDSSSLIHWNCLSAQVSSASFAKLKASKSSPALLHGSTGEELQKPQQEEMTQPAPADLTETQANVLPDMGETSVTAASSQTTVTVVPSLDGAVGATPTTVAKVRETMPAPPPERPTGVTSDAPVLDDVAAVPSLVPEFRHLDTPSSWPRPPLLHHSVESSNRTS